MGVRLGDLAESSACLQALTVTKIRQAEEVKGAVVLTAGVARLLEQLDRAGSPIGILAVRMWSRIV
jgi:hypothetical protein